MSFSVDSYGTPEMRPTILGIPFMARQSPQAPRTPLQPADDISQIAASLSSPSSADPARCGLIPTGFPHPWA